MEIASKYKPAEQQACADKFTKRISHLVRKSIKDLNMISHGDQVMVCMSGGKGSYGLLETLTELQKEAPVKFQHVAVILGQGQPGFYSEVLKNYFKSLKIQFYIRYQDTFSFVKKLISKVRTMYSLCSRLRRGTLYRTAKQLDITKIAPGHHKDDILKTFFLNLFFSGSLKTVPPKLFSDDKRHIFIRPLSYLQDKDLYALAYYKKFPIIPCNLCSSQKNLQRYEVKKLIAEREKSDPNRIKSMFHALSNVIPSHLLDTKMFDFKHE